MTSRQWQRLQELFDEVMQRPRAEREAAIQGFEKTVDDPTILQELKRLVQHAEAESGFLEPVVAHRTEPAALRLGDVIAGRFEILKRIGRGGMGEVFEAFDRTLGERVAIKVIAPEYARDSKLLERFRQEVQSARRVSHPNVCRIHDLGEHQGMLYLSMELLEGETLAKRLESGPLSLEEWQALALQLFDGLRAAHSVGIVHRDLKPSNLMLTGSRLVILDFGLATPILAPDAAGLTQAETLVGTLDWMAPEQLLGEFDERTDLYSAALVLLHALSVEKRRVHGSGLAGALRRAIRDTHFEAAVPERFPSHWRQALLACLERDPARRPAQAQAVQELVAKTSDPRLRALRTLIRNSWMQAAATIAVFLALVALGFRYLRHEGVKGLQPGSLIMIASTKNETGEARFDSLTSVLRADLEQSSHFNVWDNQRLGGVLQRLRQDPQSIPAAGQWREIAVRESAPLLVFSTLNHLGDGYSISILGEQIGSSPEPIDHWEHSEIAPGPDGLFEAVHKAAKWIRTKAGESEMELSANNRLPQNITSSKWEALELFQNARSLSAAEQTTEAITMLRRAVQLDPQFAMALMRLGDLLYAQNRKEEGLGFWRQAIELATTQQHLSEHEKLSIESRYRLEVQDFKNAEPILTDWVRKFPHDSVAAELLASCLQSMGRYEEGVKVALDAHAKFPPTVFGTSVLIRGLAATNRTAEIEKYIRTLDDLDQHALAQEFRGILAALRGQYDESARQFQELVGSADRTASSRAASLLATLEADRGSFDKARRVLQEGIESDQKAGLDGAISQKKVTLAFLEGMAGDRKLAATLAREAASGQSSALVIVEAVSVLAQFGDLKNATRIMKTLPAGKGDQFEANRLRMNGEIVAAEGKPAQALELLDRAASLERPQDPKEYLARVLDLAGDHEQARRIYQRIADSPWLIWSLFEEYWPGARYRAKESLNGPKGKTQ